MAFALEDFFPPCTDELCPRKGTDHRCVLPFQKDIIQSPDKYLAVVGGYGAGKTLPAAVLGVLLSLQVTGNRGIVLRRSYSKLHDSTERIFIEVLQRVGIEFQALENRDNWPHRLVLPNSSEILFRETKDLGRFLGPEYGWFYIDEASEEPKKTFTDLVGRLRLLQARRYLKGILTTNPPDQRHWIAEIFGLSPGVREETIKDPRTGKTTTTRYRLYRVSTRENPYNPAAYVADLTANNVESEVRRIVDGEFGFVFDGLPVYMPPFDLSRHVAELTPLDMATVRAWDFGYHCPACVWMQFPKCKANQVHWRWLHEYVGKNIEAEPLASVIVDETRSRFGGLLMLDCGDEAGAQVSDKGPGPIIRLAKPPYGFRFKYKHLPNVDPGIALIREALRRPKCKCGEEILVVNRTMRNTIEGLMGGYHYPQFRPGRPQTDRVLKPVKDGFYDNILDAARYGTENYWRGLIRNPDLLDQITATEHRFGPNAPYREQKWDWLDPKGTPEAVAAEIAAVKARMRV